MITLEGEFLGVEDAETKPAAGKAARKFRKCAVFSRDGIHSERIIVNLWNGVKLPPVGQTVKLAVRVTPWISKGGRPGLNFDCNE